MENTYNAETDRKVSGFISSVHDLNDALNNKKFQLEKRSTVQTVEVLDLVTFDSNIDDNETACIIDLEIARIESIINKPIPKSIIESPDEELAKKVENIQK